MRSARGHWFSLPSCVVRSIHQSETAPLIWRVASLLLAKEQGGKEPHSPVEFWMHWNHRCIFRRDRGRDERILKVIGRKFKILRNSHVWSFISCVWSSIIKNRRTHGRILRSKNLASSQQWWRAPNYRRFKPWWHQHKVQKSNKNHNEEDRKNLILKN